MPDRAIIPLLPALSLGFICGIVSSALLLEDGASLAVGVVGAIATGVFAGSSIFGVKGDQGEKAIVAALRVACAVGLFACVYLFMLGFLREGSIVAIVWVPLAIVFGVLLARLRVRDRGEVREASS
jgi:fatty acid desaturase